MKSSEGAAAQYAAVYGQRRITMACPLIGHDQLGHTWRILKQASVQGKELQFNAHDSIQSSLQYNLLFITILWHARAFRCHHSDPAECPDGAPTFRRYEQGCSVRPQQLGSQAHDCTSISISILQYHSSVQTQCVRAHHHAGLLRATCEQRTLDGSTNINVITNKIPGHRTCVTQQGHESLLEI